MQYSQMTFCKIRQKVNAGKKRRKTVKKRSKWRRFLRKKRIRKKTV